MARIRVVTDSACDLSADLAAEHGITVVPLSIRFGDEEFVDGRDLTTEEFWARCKASQVLPETSAPSPGAFQEAFLAAHADGYDGVLSLEHLRWGVGHLPVRGRRRQGGGRHHRGPRPSTPGR